MKVAVVSVADPRHMTCCNYYFDYLDRHNIAFDVICTKRYENSSSISYECNLIQYDWLNNLNYGKINKFRNFLKFQRFAIRLLKKNKYDFIIVWGENALVLLGNYLRRKYKNRFIYNMRDFLEGPMKYLNFIHNRAMKKAYFSTTPAPIGMDYLLGKKRYLMTNMDSYIFNNYKKPKEYDKTNHKKIVLTYMGIIVNYIEDFKKFILLFKGDDRFELRFYGGSSEELIGPFLKDNHMNNVVLGGAFASSLTVNYLEECDIINSVYGKSNAGVVGAVGVKESYAPLLHIPVISDKGCHWANVSEEYHFGFGFDIDDQDAPNKLYAWYQAIDKKSFDKGCKDYCSVAYRDNLLIEKDLDNIFLNK